MTKLLMRVGVVCKTGLTTQLRTVNLSTLISISWAKESHAVAAAYYWETIGQ